MSIKNKVAGMVPFRCSFVFVVLFFAATALLNPFYASASDYLSLEEFFKRFPEQAILSYKLRTAVHEQAQSIAVGIQKKPVHIVFIYPGKQVSDYWQRSVSSFTKRLDEIGISYKIDHYFSHPGDIRLQEAQLRAALATDPDYLVYTLDVNRHKRLIERLINKGRPKIILQNITTPLKAWSEKQPFLYVGFDHSEGTRLLAERIGTRFTRGVPYAVLFYSKGYVSQMRGDTFIRLVSDKYHGQLKASYYTDGKRDKARNAALEILNNPEIKMIYACSTDVAFGAIDALRQTGKLGSVLINGWGGGGDELQAIADGTMDLTVMRMNDDNGVAMAEAIRMDLEGKATQIPTIFNGPFVLVEKGISKDRMQVLKEYAFRYSGVE